MQNTRAGVCFLVGQTSAFFTPFGGIRSKLISFIPPSLCRSRLAVIICRAQASIPRSEATPLNVKTIGGLLFLGWTDVRLFHAPIPSPLHFAPRVKKKMCERSELTEERSDPRRDIPPLFYNCVISGLISHSNKLRCFVDNQSKPQFFRNLFQTAYFIISA